MAAKDITSPVLDAVDNLHGALVEHGILKGVLSLLEDDSFDEDLADTSGGRDIKAYSRFQAIKAAFAASLKELDLNLNAALKACNAAEQAKGAA